MRLEEVSLYLPYVVSCNPNTGGGSVGYYRRYDEYTRFPHRSIKPIRMIWTWCSWWHRWRPPKSSLGGIGRSGRGIGNHMMMMKIYLWSGGRVRGDSVGISRDADRSGIDDTMAMGKGFISVYQENYGAHILCWHVIWPGIFGWSFFTNPRR